MKRAILLNFKIISYLFLILNIISCNQKDSKIPLSYPNIVKEIIIDSIGDTTIIDPYRNLESFKNEEVISWFKNQGKLADSILGDVNAQNRIYNQLLDIESNATNDDEVIVTYKYSTNGEYYILKRDKDEKIAKLYYKKNLSSEDVMIFDPITIGKGLAIKYLELSPDNKKIAIAIAPRGVNSSTLVILDLVSKEPISNTLSDVIPSYVGGVNWLPDSSGFYYMRLPHSNQKDPTYSENSKTFLHYLDTPEDKDVEVFSIAKTPEIALNTADFPIVQTRKENPNIILGRISGDSAYKNVYYSEVTSNNSYKNPNWKPLFKQSDQIDQYFIIQDTLFYRTSKDASNFKICKAIIGSDYSKGKVIVEESKNSVITDFDIANNEIYYVRIKNGISAELTHLSDNKAQNIELPFTSGACSIKAINNNLLVSINGWTKPRTHYLFSEKKQEFTSIDFKKSSYPDIFNNLIVEVTEITSHDGVKVPLSIIRHPDSKLNGKNITKVSAYGSYGSSYSPSFRLDVLNWVASGNIYAIAHVRGGGEKGDAWHKGGFKMTKANSWKDFIACTEYLIDNKYTNTDLTIASGVSAGGIVVANAIVERPDLYKVGTILFGFINATRSEFQPNGANSIKEFGALAIPEEAQALIDMDAYLKIKEDVAYPAVYAFVGLEDSQVAAWDSAKFIARLQNDTATINPLLLSVDEDGGHGGGGTRNSRYQIYSNADSFELWQTGHPDYQPKGEKE